MIAVMDRDPACRSYLDALLYFKGFQVGNEGGREGGGGGIVYGRFNVHTYIYIFVSMTYMYVFLLMCTHRPCRRIGWRTGCGKRGETPWHSSCRAR